MSTWEDKVETLVLAARKITLRDFQVKANEGGYALFDGDEQLSSYLHPQLMSYLIAGTMLQAGYSPNKGTLASQVKTKLNSLN